MSRTFLILFATLAVCAASVFPQSISGKVLDPKGIPVAGVRLSLLHSNKVVAWEQTDELGSYTFVRLQPGTYTISVRQLGFQQERTEVRVGAGQDLHHDLVLRLESLREHVVVTATRTETPASLVGNSITVITSETIRSQNAVTVAEVLRNVPGLNVVQVGGPGSITSLFLRGGESDYTKVLLDGIPLNSPGGAVDLSNLTTANIERIEIVRGPQSALYGSDAISGVIQIFTSRGEGATTPQLGAFLEGGTYNTGRAGARAAGRAGWFSYSTEFQHLSTDNHAPNDYFHNSTFSTHLGVKTSANSSLNFTGRVERGRQGAPGQTAFGRPDLEEFSRKRDFVFGLTWEQAISDSWRHKLSYSQSYLNLLSADPIDSGSFIPQWKGKKAPFPAFDFVFSSVNASRRHNTHYQSDLFLSAHLLSLGFEWEEERGTVSTVKARRRNFGYYLQDQFLLSQRLAVTGGVRLDDNASFGFAATPRVSAAYLVRRGRTGAAWGMTRANFNFGLGIKEPTFLESFSPNPFFKGNPDLKPERTRSFEAGLEQALAADRLQLSVNSFYNRFDDQIAFQIVNPRTFEASFFNIAQSRTWGLEHTARLNPRQDLLISGGYTYLKTRVLKSAQPASPQFREGAPLLRRPTHSGFIGLTWRTGPWVLDSNATLMGSRPDSDFRGLGLTRAEAYTKWDLSVSYKLGRSVELYTTFENILNQEYFEALGFSALKFHFRSGLRFNYLE